MKGFVSISQLLGRYIRRISMVFQPDLTTRDKQHVHLPILHNLEVHKPRMRKTYLNLYLTEPLRRIIEPLRHKQIVFGKSYPYITRSSRMLVKLLYVNLLVIEKLSI